jgi:hypothetical protein
MLVEDAPVTSAPAVWSRPTRVSFRFGFSVAVVSAFHLLGFLPDYVQPEWLKTKVTSWLDPVGETESRVARSIGAAIMRLGGATGTAEEIARRYRYALLYLVAVSVVAAASTLVWSVLDRRRMHYTRLNVWLRLYARYVLAIVMMSYALVKVIPTQFGFLTPGELLKPVGQMTRFWMLWNFMVVSTGYTVFAGAVELIGCILLFFRRTALAGALLLLGALTNVFAMDIAYRVFGAAMVAGLLLALDAIVIAPSAGALIDVFVRGRARRLPDEPPPPLGPLRFGAAGKALLVAGLIGLHLPDGLAQRRTYFGQGHGVFGLFEVDRFERAGAVVTPLASDDVTWKRVGTDGRYDSGAITVQFANSDIRQFQLVEDVAARQWTLRAGGKDAATLQYTLAPDGTLSLEGRLAGSPVRMHLRPIKLNTLPLLRGN